MSAKILTWEVAIRNITEKATSKCDIEVKRHQKTQQHKLNDRKYFPSGAPRFPKKLFRSFLGFAAAAFW